MQGIEISEEELVHLSNILRSSVGMMFFSDISSYMIDTRSNLKQFLVAVADGRITLTEVLAHPEMDKYKRKLD